MQLLKKRILTVYPLVVVVLIPLLLIVNTLWNLNSFNRDANFIIRHGAISVAESLKPLILSSSLDLSQLTSHLRELADSSEDILSLTVITRNNDTLTTLVTTLDETSAQEAEKNELNQLAASFDQPFAGLVYDPTLQRSIWKVVVPMGSNELGELFLHVNMDTLTINKILSRTANDSYLVLGGLVILSLILLANHFYFYIRSLRTQQLEEIDRLKDEFISMAAHELRAPITAIIGYLQIIPDKISPSELEKIKTDIDVLQSASNDLNSLINDLLDVSRIEQDRLEIQLEDVDINNVIAEIVKIMTPMAQAKSLSLQFNQGQLPIIKTDSDRVRQVITNLVSNAIKYTLKGQVTVSTTVRDNNVEIIVKDTGVGIPAAQLPNLFSKFFRVKDDQTKEVRGTGLGLWITKRIVELLGGKIYVESIYGTGTSIVCVLPVNKA